SLVVQGSAAAVFDGQGIAVLPSLPLHADQVLHVGLPSSAAAYQTLALDEVHQSLLVGIGDGTTGALYRGSWNGSDGWTFLQTVAAPSSLALLPGGDQAALLDASAPSLSIIRGLNGGSPQSTLLASGTDGISTSAGVLYFENI